jgi:NitT/TauT family transport system permease protein
MQLSRAAMIRIVHVAFAVVLIAALESLVASGQLSELILSRPSRVAVRLWHDLFGAELWQSLGVTLREVVAAFALSMVVGSGLGLAFYRYRAVRRALEPPLVAFYSAPAILLYPVFITLLGAGSATVIVMAVIIGATPIAINVAVGLAGIEPIWRKVGRSLLATPWQMLLRILLPAAIPTIVTGFRLGLTFALIAVISLEFLLYSGGLGKLVSWRYYTFDTDGVYSAIVLVAAVAVIMNGRLNGLEAWARRRWS